jgi:hypothetical protein
MYLLVGVQVYIELYISVVVDGACLGITIRCPDQMKQKSSVET